MAGGSKFPEPNSAKGYIQNLINGVSQQPPNIRFQSQADECVNMSPTVQEQCARRNPLEVLFELSGIAGLSTNSYVHWYRRDTSEVYAIIMDGSDIQVYSAVDGSLKTVTMSQPGGDSYHESLTPKRSFYLYTYKDTTFVVNRDITPALDATLTAAALKQCLIRVKDAGNGYTYDVTVKIGANAPIVIATVTGGAASTVNTIANSIQSALNGTVVVQGGTTAVVGNVVHVLHPTDAITVAVKDNRSGTAINALTDTIQKSTDLPSYAPDGYQVKVVGSTSNQNAQDANIFDDVYYTFDTSDGSSFASGVWGESAGPGIPYIIDPETMPHTLTRQADGTFVYDDITWTTRRVGDDVTNPEPPFIGKPIHSIFLASNRLGFLAGDNFILSKVDEQNYYNFWRTTVLTSLDNDPVYGSIPSSQVNKVYWGTPFNGELMIFGDKLDGSVSWTGALALNRITINTPSRAGISPLVPPVLSGSSLIFPKNRGEFSVIYEYQIDPVTSLKTASNLTDFCGSYIPKDIVNLVGPEKEFLVGLADGERANLYPYHYSNKGGRLVQQAFHRWEFDPETEIYGIYADDLNNSLLLLYGIDGQFFIGQIELSVGSAEEFVPAKQYIDHRIDESFTGVTAIYNSGTNRTTVTLPFSLPTDRVIELRDEFDGPPGQYPAGYVIPIDSQTSTTLSLVGDWSGASFFTGLSYNSYYDPCKFQMYVPNPDGTGTVSNPWVNLLVKRVSVSYNKTGYFRLEIINRATGAITAAYALNPQYDSESTIYDTYGLYTGRKNVSIGPLSLEHYKLRLVNDSTKPSYFTGISWVGEQADGSV